MDYIVYILKTSGNTLYVGQTNNLEKRLDEHRHKSTGAKYLRQFTSFELVHQENFPNRSLALKREYAIKQLSKKDKELLIYNKLCSKSF